MLFEEILAKPKAELHLHLEGTLEPEMMFELSKRNNIKLKYKSINEIRKAYSFNNLQAFLDLYYQGMSVLLTDQDFYDLTYSYLMKAYQDNVTHTEIFVDPQAHLERGISLLEVFTGINLAIKQARIDFGIRANIIICFLRHLSENDALRAFDKIMDFRESFIGVGLDSSELGNPPSKFKRAFDIAKKEGLYLVAHAGEEGPVEYVWEAVDMLGVDRVDHGNTILEDDSLIQRIIKDDIALTMCPLSNKCLNVNSDLSTHPARILLEKGVKVTINSDDPAYFGGYVNDNYRKIITALDLSETQVLKLIDNSLKAKFI